MNSKLLVSPFYHFESSEGSTKVGRSFYSEDLGYGKLETIAGELRDMFGRIHLFDLQTKNTVYLETKFFDDPIGLVRDESASGIMEASIEYSLRALPGTPPSIYKA